MPAPKPNQPVTRFRGTAIGILCALGAAVLAAVPGTILQAQLSYAGNVPLPWGALLALALAGSLMVWTGTWTKKIWVTALAGISTYVLVALFSTNSNNQLIVGSSYFDVIPGPALAGTIWVYGIVVATVVALLIVSRTLAGAKAQRS
ncbi:hypothetical protein [Paeniglutamicibacter cryotolerans]|uniref:Uncharacterized protein n=1 Tax=Paeniglutamicibacter cryotolerans TaxID=670079 RepID=A0A839QH58_9MICC|nr:hypothetical protein [Paeniglutamicibacter cryotolerans]MBB2993815.1 hypothetical protein [Paeniglutamicibacter cryotolerans]MBB2996497.1 hypothetical protein [Paeniglutamicibacter cryotolerans]